MYSQKLLTLLKSKNKLGLIKNFIHLRQHIFYLNAKDTSKLIVDWTPLKIRIETTNTCNLKCITCPLNFPDYKRKFNTMNVELFTKIVNEIKTFRPKPDVILYLGGEPLANKNLFYFIELLKNENMFVKFNTNATLLTKEKAKLILESGLDVIEFSFDDIDPDEYEKMRINAKYDETLHNILQFLELKNIGKYKKPFVTLAGIKMSDSKLSDTLVRMQPSNHFKSLFKKYEIIDYQMWYAHKWTKSLNRKYKKCPFVYSDFNILSDGKCVPCCYDLNGEYILGDVTTDSIKEIWNNSKYQNLRNMLNNLEHEKFSPCKGCSF